MRIDGLPQPVVAQVPLGSSEELRPTGENTQSVGAERLEEYGPPEVLVLSALAMQAPEMRAEVLEHVARQVASGAYLTLNSAEKVARAIMLESENAR